jgi:hypothetical protein
MPDLIVYFVGNQDPAISEQITTDGVPVPLAGKTVKFKLRALGAETTTVDDAAQVVDAPTGQVRYVWQAADVDEEGFFLVWWEVTTTAGGKKQDLNEAVIEIREHAPIAGSYVELEDFKQTLSLTGTTFTDRDARRALVAASRAVDHLAGQRFYLDPNANSERVYTASDDDCYELAIDPLVDLTSVTVDRDGDGVFEETWVEGIDFVLEPVNAPLDGLPYRKLRMLRQSTTFGPFPTTYSDSIKVTARFGWPSVPPAIEQVTALLAARLFKVVREAPWGVVGFNEEGAVRVSRDLPDLEIILGPFRRRKLFV